MLSHGLVIAGLFICAGILTARGQSLTLKNLGGLASNMPVFAAALMFFTLANMGLPGTSGFIGEILVIVGALKVNFWVSLLGGAGMVLGVTYSLVLVRAVLFEKYARPELAGLKDLSGREYAMLLPLAVLVMWLGVYPSSFTHAFDAPINALVQAHSAALNPHMALAMVTAK